MDLALGNGEFEVEVDYAFFGLAIPEIERSRDPRGHPLPPRAHGVHADLNLIQGQRQPAQPDTH